MHAGREGEEEGQDSVLPQDKFTTVGSSIRILIPVLPQGPAHDQRGRAAQPGSALHDSATSGFGAEDAAGGAVRLRWMQTPDPDGSGGPDAE